jgi:gas vesicle protein
MPTNGNINSKWRDKLMKNKDMVVGVACGLVVGAVAGAVAALLLAPASGAETRRRLLYERDNAVEKARSKTRRAMTRLRPTRPEVGEAEEGLTEFEEEAGEEEEEVAFIGA